MKIQVFIKPFNFSSKLSIEVVFVGLLSLSMLLYFASNRTIQIIYFLPVLFVLVNIITKSTVKVDQFVIQSFIAYFSYCIIIISINFGRITNWDAVLRDIIILIGPYAVLSFQMRFAKRIVVFLFWITFICYLLSLKISIWELFNSENLAFFSSILMPHATNRLSGFIFGFILGVFPIFFYKNRDYKNLFFSIIFIFVASKRVALVGIFVVMVFSLLGIGKTKFPKLDIYIQGIIYILFALISINLIDIVSFININIFQTGLSTTELLNSRDLYYNAIRNEINIFDPIHFLFGNGPGQTDVKLSDNLPIEHRNDNGVSHVHNEFIKIFYDYGLFGLILFYLMIKSLLNQKTTGFRLLVYSISVFMLDNCLLFAFYFYLIGIISRVENIEKD